MVQMQPSSPNSTLCPMSLTFMNSSDPYSVNVRHPTSTKVVCEEKMRSPQPCVACEVHAHNLF